MKQTKRGGRENIHVKSGCSFIFYLIWREWVIHPNQIRTAFGAARSGSAPSSTCASSPPVAPPPTSSGGGAEDCSRAEEARFFRVILNLEKIISLQTQHAAAHRPLYARGSVRMQLLVCTQLQGMRRQSLIGSHGRNIINVSVYYVFSSPPRTQHHPVVGGHTRCCSQILPACGACNRTCSRSRLHELLKQEHTNRCNAGKSFYDTNTLLDIDLFSLSFSAINVYLVHTWFTVPCCDCLNFISVSSS